MQIQVQICPTVLVSPQAFTVTIEHLVRDRDAAEPTSGQPEPEAGASGHATVTGNSTRALDTLGRQSRYPAVP